ncbi:MAG TPA: TonB-dependent receptor, partial [Cupriavidus sp.]|nr:TonB-dependent receptor [Cupriavidus sp.]
MTRFPLRAVAAGVTSTFVVAAQAQSAESNPPASPSSPSATEQPATNAGGDKTLNTVVVSAKRLDEARNALSPETGSSVYRFDSTDIQTLP